MRKSFNDIQSETHESYGLVKFSRTSGTPRSLFGSTIKHSDTIRLTISEGKVHRDFQKNYYMDGKELIEVEMSSAQFAELITTLNCGSGVPATLIHHGGKKMADPPEVDFKERAKTELKEEMKVLGERIEELAKDAKEILTRKGAPIKADEKAKILQDLMLIVQEVKSNIPFAHECFQGAVDETVVEAKAEIDNCMTTMRERLGQAVLDNKIQIPLLESKENNEPKQ